MKRERSRDSWASILVPLSLILGLVLLLSINVGQGDEKTFSGNPLESWLKLLVGYMAAGAEIAAALVIGVAILRGLSTYLHQLLVPSKQHLDSTESIRLQLGRVLALGLEFTVASDILRTAVAPTRQDILNLGSIVLLRTLLNYFLEQEIRQGEARRTVDREPSEQI
jgi:uncharacterized membrane protein